MKRLIALFMVSICCGCEQLNISDIEDNDKGTTGKEKENINIIFPGVTGRGTVEAPYTTTQVLQLGGTLLDRDVWIISYAVGEAYSGMKNATFDIEECTHGSNILLSDDSLCTSPTNILPVELNKTALKTAIGLNYNPLYHRQCIVLQGTITAYLGQLGIRTVTHHMWFPNHTIPQNVSKDWEKDNYTF